MYSHKHKGAIVESWGQDWGEPAERIELRLSKGLALYWYPCFNSG